MSLALLLLIPMPVVRFPLVPVPPTCREAWIVCLADKWCALRETIAGRLPRKGGANDLNEGPSDGSSKESNEKRSE